MNIRLLSVGVGLCRGFCLAGVASLFWVTSSGSSQAAQLEPPLTETAQMAGLRYLDANGQPQYNLPLHSEVKMQVAGLTNRVMLTQTFVNNSEDWIDGSYMFPLPNDAAVDSMQLLIGERKIEGQILQKKLAQKRFDEAKQQAFIEAYEALKASCDKDESIVFIDAVHPTLSTKISHGWIRTGQDKVIETTGNRSRLNIIGALNLSDISATIVDDYESINSESIVRFFCKLRESYPLAHKLHIILDGAGYHRSDLVKDAAFVLNIELHYLPPYSPNLNPIERLWKVMNEKSRNNVYFKSKRDFKAAIDQFFTVTLPEIAGSLTSRINDNFQVLKPASSS